MHDIYLKHMDLPQPYPVKIPIWNAKARPLPQLEDVTIKVILPHEMFAWVYKRHRHAFDTHLGGALDGSLTDFWAGCDIDDEIVAPHPYIQPDQLDRTICLLYTSDAADE